jgi:hypothetical protein
MTIKKVVTQVKGLLSTKTATALILLIATLGRLIQVLFFFNIGVDRSFQFQATDSLLKGHGVALAEVLASDLSTTVYVPLIKWPPGYTVLVAPFYALFGQYYVPAGIVLDMIFAIVLILFSRKVLHELDVATWLINIYTLVAGFFIYEFYFYSSSDAIVTALFIVTLYYTLRFLKGALSWQKASLTLGVLLLVLASFKYSFIPALFVIPLFLLVKGWANQNLEERKVGMYALLIVAVGLASILLYQKSISGSAAYVTDAISGFFPENLVAVFPLLSEAFIKPHTLTQLFRIGSGIAQPGLIILQVAHLLLWAVAIVFAIRMIRNKGFSKLSPLDSFLYLAFFVSLAISLLLTVLSLRIAKDTENWTFIQEGRYYGVASVFVHLAFFVLYQHAKHKFTSFLNVLFYALFSLLFVEGCRGVFFTFNRVRYFGKEEYSWQYEDRLQKYADGIIQKAREQYNIRKVAVTGSSYYYNHRIHLYSHVPMMHDAAALNIPSSLRSKEPVILVVMIHERHMEKFQPFLSKEGNLAIGNFDGHSFYTVYVTPR